MTLCYYSPCRSCDAYAYSLFQMQRDCFLNSSVWRLIAGYAWVVQHCIFLSGLADHHPVGHNVSWYWTNRSIQRELIKTNSVILQVTVNTPILYFTERPMKVPYRYLGRFTRWIFTYYAVLIGPIDLPPGLPPVKNWKECRAVVFSDAKKHVRLSNYQLPCCVGIHTTGNDAEIWWSFIPGVY